MMALRHLITPGSLCHATDAHALVGIHQGEIHIQAHTQRQSLFQHALRNLSYQGAQGLEIGIVAMVAEREGHRGDIFHTALDGDTHRTTIVRVHRTIIAMIDAANDHIGLTRTEFGQSHLHTVDGGAVARPDLDVGA